MISFKNVNTMTIFDKNLALLCFLLKKRDEKFLINLSENCQCYLRASFLNEFSECLLLLL